MKRIIAKFDDHELAVKAGGALLDHGVEVDDFDLVAGDRPVDHEAMGTKAVESKKSEIEHGVTSTTGADAAEGAKKGGFAGLALGALAGIASLLIPGYGIVLGGGALAAALGAAVGTGAAGAIAGGVTGYLKDMGVDEHVARDYEEALKNGGAIVSVKIVPDKLEESDILGILNKYGAEQIEVIPTASYV